MHTEHRHWYTARFGREMGVAVYGHYGAPLLAFPTTGGDEWEMQHQGMIGALEEFLEVGRLKLFAVTAVNNESFFNKGAHPFHRSHVQRLYDEYIRWEVIPFIQDHCKTPGLPVSTMGPAMGAYHAANTLLKHPDVVNRCFALSGVYDLSRYMDGLYDENFYFNNPMDYLEKLADPEILGQLALCEVYLVTGSGPWEDSGPSYRLAELLRRRGIPHHVDDWGPQGGHDWPFWKQQMREYVGRLFY